MEKRRSAKRRRVHVGFASLLAASLAACSSVSSLVGLGPQEEPTAACPVFGRMAEADRLIRFDGRVGDPARVVYEAEIIDVAANCVFDDGEFEAAAGMRVRATAGPAWTGEAFDVPVVIAHASGRRQVLTREIGRLSLAPPDGRTDAEADFTVEYELRLSSREDLADDKILFGLRPSRAELNYLRRR
ncbi:MAG: hypothetical protein AAF360_10080 [Pseudomonadota bacterium]